MIFSKIKLAAAAATIAFIAFLLWERSQSQEREAMKDKQIGALTTVIQERNQKIEEIEKEKARLIWENQVTSEINVAHKKTVEGFRKSDRLLREEVDRLKVKNEALNKYIDAAMPHDVVRLFPVPDCETREDNRDENQICKTADGAVVTKGNPRYPTESLINYALDCTVAFNSCRS